LSDECVILREWAGDQGPVFLDFSGERELWWIRKGLTKGSAYIARFSRNDFIERHRNGATQSARDFDVLLNAYNTLVLEYESFLKTRSQRQIDPLALIGLPTNRVRRRSRRL
jgi:hypothetical protein